jgi:hypothetical protein
MYICHVCPHLNVSNLTCNDCSGVLLGVALRHGITPNVQMSSFFWKVLSKAAVNPYATQGHDSSTSPGATEGGRSSSNSGNSRPGRRAQELYSGVREACARALRHGIVSVLPEVCWHARPVTLEGKHTQMNDCCMPLVCGAILLLYTIPWDCG